MWLWYAVGRKTSWLHWCALGKCSFLSPSNLWTVFIWCSPLLQKKSVFYYYVLQKRCIRSTILLNGTLCDFSGSPILSCSLLGAANFFFKSLLSGTSILICSLYLCRLCAGQPSTWGCWRATATTTKMYKTVWCTQFLSTCDGFRPTYTYMHTQGNVIFLSCVPWPFSEESVSSCCDLAGICFAFVVAEHRAAMRQMLFVALCVPRHTRLCVSLSVSAAV